MNEEKEISKNGSGETVAESVPNESANTAAVSKKRTSTGGTKKTTPGGTKKNTASGEKKTTASSTKKTTASGTKKTTASSEKKTTASGTKATATTSTKRTRKPAEKKATEAPPSQIEDKTASVLAEAEPLDPAIITEDPVVSIPLESLAFDSDDIVELRETPEEAESRESYFRDYQAHMDEVLNKARDSAAEHAATNTDTPDDSITEAPAEDTAVAGTEDVPTVAAEADAEPTVDSVNDVNEAATAPALDDVTDDSVVEAEATVVDTLEAEPVAEAPHNGDMADAEDSEANSDDGQLSIAFGIEKEETDAVEPEAEPRDKNKYDPEHPRFIDSVFEFVELFAFTLVAVMLITTFFVRYSRVDGSSMDMTLADGDNLIISGFMYTPERGDIIVFEDYGTDLREPLVKRVIGIEGDKVEVKPDGSVYVNDVLLDEPYVYVTPGRDPTRNYGTWHVGEGELFVLGDHRDVSKDSREFGTIKSDSVLGEVKLRFYPFDKFGIPK